MPLPTISVLQMWPLAAAVTHLPAGVVHVWSVPLDDGTVQPDRRAPLLAPDEHQRAAQFHFERDRERFIAGRTYLRLILSRYAGRRPEQLRLGYGQHGKPFLAGGDQAADLYFNVSHSDGLMLCAVTRGREIGVDVERVRPLPRLAAIAGRYFSAAEQRALAATPPYQLPEAFFNGWTRKEAYLKAQGGGLPAGLDQFAVTLQPGEPARLLHDQRDPRAPAHWSLVALHPAPDYAAAVASPGPIEQLECWRFA